METENPHAAAEAGSQGTSTETKGASSEAQDTSSGANSAPSEPTVDELTDRVIEVLKTCFDPEIPVNIYELGLVYSVKVDPPGDVKIQMTLTSPACPVAGSLPPEVEAKVRSLAGVTNATVDVVWEPPWTPAMMSEAARLQLNLM